MYVLYREDRPDFNLRLQIPGPLTSSLLSSGSDASLSNPIPNPNSSNSTSKGSITTTGNSNSNSNSSRDRDIVSDLVEFIDVSLHHGISVLLFSTKGQCRCATAAVVYFMKKYRWSLPKTMDYVLSRKPDIQINRGFLLQLAALDKQLLLINCIPEKRNILLNHLKQENHGNSNSNSSSGGGIGGNGNGNDANSQSMLAMIASATLSKDDYAR